MASGSRFLVFGEDDSDFKTLKVIIRRLARNDRLPIAGRGYSGCGELLKKCARDIRTMPYDGPQRIVIAHDADSSEPARIESIRAALRTQVVKPSGAAIEHYCLVIPVQEIEAWILADLDTLRPHFRFRKCPRISEPERQTRPKELLVTISRDTRRIEHYRPQIHNPLAAAHLDLELVRSRCPSFQPLYDFVRSPAGRTTRSRS